MNERLYLIRKETGLSRAAFGNKIGVSGDVINNLERGRVEIKDSIVKLVCAVFSVDETWLRTGNGEMFISTSDALLEQLSREYNLDEFSERLLFSFLRLSSEKRKAVLDYVRHTVALFNGGILSDTQEGDGFTEPMDKVWEAGEQLQIDEPEDEAQEAGEAAELGEDQR